MPEQSQPDLFSLLLRLKGARARARQTVPCSGPPVARARVPCLPHFPLSTVHALRLAPLAWVCPWLRSTSALAHAAPPAARRTCPASCSHRCEMRRHENFVPRRGARQRRDCAGARDRQQLRVRRLRRAPAISHGRREKLLVVPTARSSRILSLYPIPQPQHPNKKSLSTRRPAWLRM